MELSLRGTKTHTLGVVTPLVGCHFKPAPGVVGLLGTPLVGVLSGTMALGAGFFLCSSNGLV